MKNPFGIFKRTSPPVTPDQILAALGKVLEPEAHEDLVSLGMVHNVAARAGTVSFTIRLREAGSPLQVPIERRARRAVEAIPGVREVDIRFETSPTSQLRETSPLNLSAKYIIAVASSKGGVGKSTVSTNLAVGLAQKGLRVGLLDGDIHGPNIPLMMGIRDEHPIAFGDQVYPPSAHNVTVMSMGFLIPAEAPVIWRGPMMHQAIRQLVRDVMWGQLDYLIVDLPPGTGDVQLTLTQSLPLTGTVMVTTPQEVALADVLKGGEMFHQLDVPLLGVIENMSFYICPHCGKPDYIFGDGGGEKVSQQLRTTLLARVPLDSAVRASGDGGVPVVLSAPESPAGKVLRQAIDAVVDKVGVLPARPKPIRYMPDPDLRILP